MATSRVTTLRGVTDERDGHGGHDGTARARSAALRDDLVDRSPQDAVATVVAGGPAYVAALLGRDWMTVVDHVRRGESVAAGVAWRAAYALQHLGHSGDAAAVLREADLAGASEADRSRLAGVDASIRWTHGDEAGCRARTEEALGRAKVAADESAEGAAWVVQALLAASTGDRDANLRCYQRGLLLAERAGDLLTVERIRNNLGARELEEGRYAEALDELHRGLEVNERTGHLSGLAVLRHNVAEALFGLGRLDEALIECDAARDLWTAIEAPSAGVSWHLRGQIQTARGNSAQAAMSYRHSAALAAAEGDVQTQAMALVGHAAACAGSDIAEAIALAERALALPTPV
ncbi:MAG: hypothetical protein QM572_16475, partial [Nocardioides sp.]|uniref:hypothetical protein n=1 Tax=Nocardioides sp. TaxID=35761 RepID=UPI0039E510C3